MNAITLGELSTHLSDGGLDNELRGDPGVRITGCNTLEAATKGEITFLANPKYRDKVADSRASAIIMRDDRTLEPRVPQIVCDDPYRGLTMAVIKIHGFRKHPAWGVDRSATIDPSAKIGANPNIAPGATICANVRIGDNVTLYPGVFVGPSVALGDDVVLHPNVVVYDGCALGNRVTVHAGTVIGEDGLGFAPVGDKWLKIPQAGQVIIEDDVELGANCTIDRATLGTTRIGSGTKFSNLVAVGHGCQIGPDCLLVAQVGLAGSVVVGRHVTLAGQAGVAGHLSIGDNASVYAKAGVTSSVGAGESVLGAPAVLVADARRQFAALHRLPEVRQRLRDLERGLEDIRQELAAHGASTKGES